MYRSLFTMGAVLLVAGCPDVLPNVGNGSSGSVSGSGGASSTSTGSTTSESSSVGGSAGSGGAMNGCDDAIDGTLCDDGDACTQTDTCQSGVCKGGVAVVCAVPDQCHVAGTCDKATGGCSNPNSAEGIACNDTNACTQVDICQSGACVGLNPVVCAPLDQCHVATCNMVTGECSNSNKANGLECNDANACTQADTCQNGVCVGGAPVICAALDPCHVAGTCDKATGACSNPSNVDGIGCNDSNACTQTDACQSGVCVGLNPVICMPLDQCHVAGICDAATGQCSNPNKANGLACNDANACTQTDACQNGACVGANPVVCAALSQCHTAGNCNSVTGACSNPTKPNGAACNDGSACTQTDTCVGGACVGANPILCMAFDQCHVAGNCDVATGICSNPPKSNGVACNDGNACTQIDACSGGACIGANPVVCGALDQCHTAGSCNSINGTCSNPIKAIGTACNDGNLCTKNDFCNGGGFCSGTAIQVNWIARAPLSQPDNTIIAATLNGQIHVFGWTFFLRHRVFTPATNSWVQKNDLPSSAAEGWAGVIGTSLYAFGEGLFGGDSPMKWDGLADSWSVLAPNPWPRRLPASAIINGKAYLAGGFTTNGERVNVYDPNANTWTNLATLPVLADGVNTAVGYGGKLYVFGVAGGNSNPTQGERYDPATNAWTALTPLQHSRYGSRALLIGSAAWLLGGSSNGDVQDSIFIYDMTTGAWCEGPSLPEPLYLMAVEQVNGKIYTIGGYDPNGTTSHVWEGSIQ